MKLHLHLLAVLTSVALFGNPARGQSLPAETVQGDAAPSTFRSAEDGWFDLSHFMDGRFGFLPVFFPVTEPAVGYGAGGGLAFVDKSPCETSAGMGRPNIMFMGGLGTENGTWGTAAGDLRNWCSDRLQTLAGVVYASVGLDFYGIRDDSTLSHDPLPYTLDPKGAGLQTKYRLGASRTWIGLAYAFARTKVTFEAPEGTPGLPDQEGESDVGCVVPSLTFDSRDNIFTPISGTYVDASVALFGEALGGDADFQRVQIVAMQYIPLGSRLYLGLRGDFKGCYGDAPFYLEPFVGMRGAPAMRYQGDDVLQIEAELRWQFWNRFSLVGFGGHGEARTDLGRSNPVKVVRFKAVDIGGFGFRYELARKYGIHAGVDVAFGPDDTAIYFQTGSAWLRP